MKKQEKVVVILGPTSSGKTDLSISLAQKFNGEIISADSRQVYKELNLLSGKVTEDEMKDVPHYMLNVTSVSDLYSVALYKKEATKALLDILKKEKLPFIVGGTGFYIDSLVYDINFPEVEADHKLRSELEQKSNQELFEILQKMDLDRSLNIDLHNPIRLVRAIEVATSLGKNPPPPSYEHSAYDTLFIGLDLPDEILKERISKRIQNRLDNGMVDEALKILEMNIPSLNIYSLGLDVKYAVNVAQGKITTDELKEGLARDTWQFVRRQRTWWNKNKTIKWFDPVTNVSEIENEIKNFLDK